MRIVLADIEGNKGFLNKDTVAGGYGSRLTPFSRVTWVYSQIKQRLHRLPSIQLAYLAAIATRSGHEVSYSSGDIVHGDVAIVLSSLVDYRRETAWADAARKIGMRVGFIGLAASKMPELFSGHADFVIQGEPESAMLQLVSGATLVGVIQSPPISNLDILPFPHWDLEGQNHSSFSRMGKRWARNGFPVSASRSCPEFCTYCPHRILASYRARSIQSIADELEHLCEQAGRPYVIFRDPLFTEKRERCLELCDEIRARKLTLRFEFETRLDRLDDELLTHLHAAGLRAINFGVEAVSAETLRRVGRRPIPESQQRAVIEGCSRRGIDTSAFYVFGFLQDDWNSISATVDYAIDLGSTVAQFKILTPYPGTPLWKQLSPLVYETDWEKFDGFTPTFNHPKLTAKELKFLLGAAYSRYYIRPSWVANYLRIRNQRLRDMIEFLDQKAFDRHAELEMSIMSRSVTC